MRILVTGASGFVGFHLVNYFIDHQIEVWGIDRVIPDVPRNNTQFIKSELSSAAELVAILRQVKPTHVIHLAGVLGNASYQILYQVNVISTVHLLEAIRQAGYPIRMLLASSSGVYGATTPEKNPLREETPLRPVSHYGASKLAQENAGRQYFDAYQIPVVIVRTFNLSGPGLSPALLASGLARQIVQRELGQTADSILVGNLWPRRDYVDVRDAVKAYAGLLTHGQPGQAYNLCTGRSYSVQECLDGLLKQAHCPVTVQQDPQRIRHEEVADQIGDFARLHAATGWQPAIPFEQSLADLLQHWRTILTKENSL